MFGETFYKRVWNLGFWQKGLVSVLVFLIFGIPIYYLSNYLGSGYPLFILFLPLILTSGFYFKRWSLFPSFLASFSLLLLSILHYGQMFFDWLWLSLLNLAIFAALFSIVSVLVGHITVSFRKLKREKREEVTERKEAERDFKRYAEGVSASDDSIYMIDEEHRYVFANEEHLSRLVEDGRISRKSEDEVVGKKYREIHPEEDSKVLEKNVEEVIETGESRTIEHDFSSVDRWSSRTYSPIRDSESGEAAGVIVVSKDITGRKKAEEREKFLHSLLRHDVRNKAQIEKGYFELLQEEDLSDRGREYLEKAENACDEAVEIIEKVRKLRNIEGGEEVGEVELRKIIEEVIGENQDRLSEMDIDLDCGDFESKVKGGPLLKELFSNLLENAVRHSNCNKIRIYSQEKDNERVVTIEDDGCGILEGDKEKIFEKGYKKSESPGSGLGLYMVKEIAENYGGNIEVKDSELGGARFDVHLERA